MARSESSGPSPTGPTFRNPLHGEPFADPFVLKFNGRYYAYGTPVHGRALPVLTSSDLVHWEFAGEALPAPPEGLAHWAPEVAYDNGQFLLYCSTGGVEGEHHRLRVFGGTSPTGPFDQDLGLLDPHDAFTIDAHPFRDDDGRWYLFYSRDFLDGDRAGTGIVVDRLVTMTALAGERVTVMRPCADWHLYQRRRRWYDRVWDWYTVEGPFVRRHDGRYWCFYSGGAWKEENYGIGSAVADHPMGPYEAVAAADTPDVLRTLPGTVIGPGHGSVTVAPDNVTEYLVYHAWDLEHTGRYMHADLLTWAQGRPQSPGPRTDPQPCPPEPLFRDLFDPTPGGPRRSGAWDLRGRWTATTAALAHAGGDASASAVLDVGVPESYLFEVNLALPGGVVVAGGAGVVISYDDDENHTAVFVDPDHGQLRWHVVRDGDVERDGSLGRLRTDFAAAAYHQLVVQRTDGQATVRLDGVSMGSVPALKGGRRRVGVWTSRAPVTVSGVSLTEL